MYKNFYHKSLKRVIVAFGSLFDNINITLGNGKEIRVPIHYAQKEKFTEVLSKQPDKNAAIKNVTMPVMGYEIIGLNYAPERNKNPLHKMRNCNDKDADYMYNRVPYDIMVELYVATKRLDDSFKIAEQILANFAPEISVKVKEIPELDIEGKIDFNLTSSSFSVNYEDDFNTVRWIEWQFSFTIKTYMYRHIDQQTIIKNAVVEAVNGYDDSVFARFTALADANDNVTTTIEEGPLYD